MSCLVTGPGCEGRQIDAPIGAGISFAQTLASNAEEEGTWYVREGDQIRYHVIRTQDGIVETWERNGEPTQIGVRLNEGTLDLGPTKGPVVEEVELG